MTNICVVLLCGLPGAGKTTFAKELGSYLGARPDDKRVRWPDPDIAPVPGSPAPGGRAGCSAAGLVRDSKNEAFRLVHVCYDKLMPKEIELQLLKDIESGGNVPTSAPDSILISSSKWKDYRNNIVLFVDVVLEKLCRTFAEKSPECQVAESLAREDHLVRAFQDWQEAVFDTSAFREVSSSNKFAVIIDDNMYYESMRYQYFKLARKYNTGFLQVYFPVSTESALTRNERRGSDRVPEHVIRAMAQKMDIPVTDVPWQKNTYCWTEGRNKVEQMEHISQLLHQALCDPVRSLSLPDEQQTQKSQVLCSQSVLHQLDTILRKLVSKKIQETKGLAESSKERLQMTAATCNGARTQILEGVRNKTLLLPPHLEPHIENAASRPDNVFYLYVCDMFNKLLAKEH